MKRKAETLYRDVVKVAADLRAFYSAQDGMDAHKKCGYIFSIQITFMNEFENKTGSPKSKRSFVGLLTLPDKVSYVRAGCSFCFAVDFGLWKK